MNESTVETSLAIRCFMMHTHSPGDLLRNI